MIKISCNECGSDLTSELCERLGGSFVHDEGERFGFFPELDDAEGLATSVLFEEEAKTSLEDTTFLAWVGAMLIYALTSPNPFLCKKCSGPMVRQTRKELMKSGKLWGKPGERWGAPWQE